MDKLWHWILSLPLGIKLAFAIGGIFSFVGYFI